MAREWEERLGAAARSRIPGAQRDVGVMSGGQRQAIAVLRAVAFASRARDPRRADGRTRRARVAPGARPRPAPARAGRRGRPDLAQPRARERRSPTAPWCSARDGPPARPCPTPDNHEALVSMIVGAAPAHAGGGGRMKVKACTGGRARGRRAGRRLRRRRDDAVGRRGTTATSRSPSASRWCSRRSTTRSTSRRRRASRLRPRRRPASTSASAPAASGPRRTR